ncbi:antirestriction protein [Bordetella bronchialis]|uniref:antirestriction protein n=1 Tax=Bordetella bronchialis TaxID=463025 RepID=UPI003CFF0446
MTQAQAISTTVRLVPDNERMNFLPKHFGQRLMLAGELAVYGWLDRLSEDYRGGYWHYYEIPGSFYMAPTSHDTLRIVWPLNWCDRTMSADAAGIVATLYALSELCQRPQGADLVDKYYALREFASVHAEASAILAAID